MPTIIFLEIAIRRAEILIELPGIPNSQLEKFFSSNINIPRCNSIEQLKY